MGNVVVIDVSFSQRVLCKGKENIVCNFIQWKYLYQIFIGFCPQDKDYKVNNSLTIRRIDIYLQNIGFSLLLDYIEIWLFDQILKERIFTRSIVSLQNILIEKMKSNGNTSMK